MCGIAGIIHDTNENQLQSTLQRMTNAILHRGPDEAGFYVHNNVGLGMRRLSIIDVQGGKQPIANETGDVQVVSNGEIYNHRDLRKPLVAAGHLLKSHTDTEVIAHLYEDAGTDCFRQMRGMFGTAIWDNQKQQLVLGRDRLGKKPLYYAFGDDGQFLFGSEIKSLLAADGSLREPDYTRLAEYLQFGYIHEPHTFYRRIHKIPAGHYGVWKNGKFSTHSYWDLEFKPDNSRSWEDWTAALDAAVLDAVSVRLESEVPLGVFLSGGIDSSAIVAYAHAAGLSPLRTFTIAFDRPEWDESDDARQVAEHFGTEHHNLELTEAELRRDFADTLATLTRHFDEPFGDDSALPTFHVSRLARKHVTVILSGDGGDELFAGYSSYQGAIFAQQYRRLLPAMLGKSIMPSLAGTLAKCLPGRFRYQALRAQKVFRESALPFEQSVRDKASIFTIGELSSLLDESVFANCALAGRQHLPDKMWEVLQSDRDVVSRLSEIDLHTYMRDDILMKVDRMSMANSLEVRSPLLDHNVVELAASMPTDVKLKSTRTGWIGKAVLKEVLRKKLPKRTIRKRKQGFAVPLRDWFRHGLSDVVGDYLQYGGGRLPTGVFAPEKVNEILKQHRQGTHDHGRKIWLLLSLASWNEQYGASLPDNDNRLVSTP